MPRQQRPRVYFNVTDGWCVDFHVTLTQRELQAIAKYMIKVQTDRMRGAVGSKRKEIEFSIELLRKGAIKQTVHVEQSGVKVLYER